MDDKMKAAVLKSPHNIKVEEIPKWELKEDMVMVKVMACGICGSDLRYFEGENPWALHTLGEEVPNPPNMVLGHEFSGEVVEVGSDAFKGMIGKRVGALCYVTCGRCRFCRTGRHNLCPDTIHIGHGAGWGDMEFSPGAMAEYCPVWAVHCYELPDHLSYEEGALLDPLQVGVHAVDGSGIKPGDSVAVLGAGPVGLFALQVARAYGAGKVLCTDVFSKPLQIAAELGADRAIDARKEDVVGIIMDATDGFGADIVIDTIGSHESLQQGLDALAVSGTLVNLALHAGKISFEGLKLGSERSIRTSSNSMFQDYQKALDLAASGMVKLTPMVTHRFDLSEIEKAFEIMSNKEEHEGVKAVIYPFGT